MRFEKSRIEFVGARLRGLSRNSGGMARKKARLAGGGRAAGGIPDDIFEVGKGGKSAQKVKIKVDFSFHLKIGKN